MTDVNPAPTRPLFELLPAIDLRGGNVVRLRQGDFARETAYDEDPLEVVRRFREAGASGLHVVDLDGAVAGRPVQGAVVSRILAAVGDDLEVQVAGGIRDAAAVRAALASGARRVVLGTAALADPAFVGRMVREHGADRVVVALDVRDGLAIGEGWRRGAAGTPVDEAARRMLDVGVRLLAVTAIARDGLLGGPDLPLLAGIVDLPRAAVIASGGVSTLDDLQAIRRIGCTGAIVGRALYEGRLDLAAAVAMLGDAPDRG